LEGSPDHVYRLSIGALPYVVGFWPLSISAHHVGTIHLVGYNLSQMDMDVPASPTGEITLPLPAQVRARVPLRLTVAELPTAPAPLANHDLAHAAPLTPPMVANGRLYDEARPEAAAVDYYSFEAQQGQSWVIETRAAMAGSPVDTKIEVLDAQGQRVPYLLLQAMRDSYINFRSVDAINPDLRLENWREMALNQYVYLNGDIIRIFRMPRGPDSGILFYADRGKRLSYFNSSATAHSLDEPCYIVEPHPVGTTMVPNGLPVFTLYYQNDDDPSRQLGQDSRLIFTAPATGRYHVRVSDTRGWSGDRYAYELTLREPKPSYTVALASGTTVNVAAGSGASLALRADRRDGFDGDITVTAENVPPGLFIPSPTVIQGGHNLANACLYARPDLTPGKIDLSNLKLTATAQIGAQTVSVPLPAFTSITVDPALPQTLFIEPDANGRPAGDGKHAPEKPFEVTLAPGSTVSVWLRVDRHGNDALVSMDVENLPHGVIVDNIGLNGVQIRAGENEREIFLACAPWVQEQDRYCQIIVGSARNDASRTGKEQTSFPVLLKVRKNATAGRTAQR